jgi:Xaa-Pro aminopeptidase
VGEGRIAIELDFMPAKDYIHLVRRLPKARFEECRDIYFRTRMIKTGEEVAILRRIGGITDRVIGGVLHEIRAGQTEKEVYRNVWNKMLAAGVDSLKCQVGSGARSGITNCAPTTKIIEAGDMLRVEILGDLDGYRSNLTRTAVLGKPTDEQVRTWDTLIRAREACKPMLKPGTPVAEVYRTYVRVCRGSGVEPTLKFLGHGIGQTIHEEPYLTDTRTTVFQENICFTMEPLYMMPGRMGFHVEDMYRITLAGYDTLSGDITPNDRLIEIG